MISRIKRIAGRVLRKRDVAYPIFLSIEKLRFKGM
jgi:hypothetical protein